MISPKSNIKTLFIVTIWLIAQIVLFLKNGIVTSGEATKYIWQADQLLQVGKPTSSNYWFYFTQILLIAVDKLLNMRILLVIAVQLCINLIATFSFYKLVAHIFFERIALVATLLFLLNYPYHEFNTFAQTESLYFSLALIFSSYLLRINALNKKNIIALSIYLLVLTFTRPTGILFAPPALLYLLLKFPQKTRLYVIVASTLPLILILNLAMGSGGKLDFMLPFKTNQVICGIPRYENAAIKIHENGNSILGLLYYIANNWGQFIRLAIQKTFVFFGLQREYFSKWHNLFLATFFYTLYLGVILSIRKWFSEKRHYFIYFTSTILITWITTVLTCDDWHNRFFLAISPYLIILSLPAIIKLARTISSGTFFHTRY